MLPAFGTHGFQLTIEALPDPDAKRPSKQDEVIAMLRRPEGATVNEVRLALQNKHFSNLPEGTIRPNNNCPSES